MKKILLLAILFTNTIFARFDLQNLCNIDVLLERNGLDASLFHPVIGEIYKPVLCNMRLMDAKNYEIDNTFRSKDNPVGPISSIIKEFFLSPSGNLSINRMESSISNYLDSYDIGKLIRYIKNNNQDSIRELLGCKKNKKSIDEFIENLNNSETEIKRQNFLPQDFIEKILLTFLNEKFSKKEDLKNFLEGLTGKSLSIDDFGINKKELENFVGKNSFESKLIYPLYVEQYKNCVPYSTNEKFSCNANSELIIENKKELKTIATFSNCDEAALNYLFDIILYNGSGEYSYKNYNGYLYDFYKKRFGDQTSKWLEVVSNLKIDPMIINRYGNIYRQRVYVDKKEFEYEIYPGIISNIIVIAYITNKVEVLKKLDSIRFDDLEDSKSKLSEIFKELLNGLGNFKVNVECKDLKNGKRYKTDVNDFFGNLEITISKDGNKVASFEWSLMPKHSQIKNLNYEAVHTDNPLMILEKGSIFAQMYQKLLLDKNEEQAEFVRNFCKTGLEKEANDYLLGNVKRIFQVTNWTDRGAFSSLSEILKNSDTYQWILKYISDLKVKIEEIDGDCLDFIDIFVGVKKISGTPIFLCSKEYFHQINKVPETVEDLGLFIENGLLLRHKSEVYIKELKNLVKLNINLKDFLIDEYLNEKLMIIKDQLSKFSLNEQKRRIDIMKDSEFRNLFQNLEPCSFNKEFPNLKEVNLEGNLFLILNYLPNLFNGVKSIDCKDFIRILNIPIYYNKNLGKFEFPQLERLFKTSLQELSFCVCSPKKNFQTQNLLDAKGSDIEFKHYNLFKEVLMKTLGKNYDIKFEYKEEEKHHEYEEIYTVSGEKITIKRCKENLFH